MVALDDRGLWPKTWPYDNEHITGHYTGHNFWVILGLRYAILMAKDMDDEKKVKEWSELYDEFSTNFLSELEKITAETDGYIPPGMDNPNDGYDWANASAGLYPFEVIDKDDSAVKKTLEIVRDYNYMEGISSYSGCNALVAKQKILSNEELPERGLHHYETFYVTNGNLIIGEQQKVIEDLYSILVHTSSTNAGFEWKPTPWGNRDVDHNRTPHGWMAARYIELLRNMLVREEKNDIHLMSSISPYWVKQGESIEVKEAPTYMGTVSYSVLFGKNKMTISLRNNFNETLENLFIHIPWFVNPSRIIIDGVPYINKDVEKIALPKSSKKIEISWRNKITQELSFDIAVDHYLNKFHNRSNTENYVTLFPSLAAPKVLNQDSNSIELYSPGNIGTVYYTVNGEEPTENSIKYKKSINIEAIKQIKAIVVDETGKVSDCLILNLKK